MTGLPAYLVADIGATNARFAWAQPSSQGSQSRRWSAPLILRTADYSSSDELVDQALLRLESRAPVAVGLAVAGPVVAGEGRLTNGDLRFRGAELARRLGCPVSVVNDFYALARALPDLERLEPVGDVPPPEASPSPPGVKAVLGPGTGLGMAALVPVEGHWHVLASEGGHADLAPGSPLELEILSVLQAAHGHVSWETVLSGRGLVRLYGAVCQVWGTEPEALGAEEVTARGADAGDPVCHQTLEVFFSLLGAAAGNLALTVYARGGVYVGGGIVPALADFAVHSPLRRRFDERGAMSGMIRAVPLYLIMDAAPGLTGVLGCLRDELARA